MSDNNISNEQDQKFLVELAMSGDPIFQAYTNKVQEISTNLKSQAAEDLKQDFINKWTRNLERYAASADATVSQYAADMLVKFTKLSNGEISLEDFKSSTKENPSEENIDLNSTSNIRNCIIKLFE